MNDMNSLILWASPKKETKHEQIQKVYQILSLLKDFGEPFNPRYLPAKSKKDCKPFFLNYENIEFLLKKSKRNEEIDEKLGVGNTIGFFSSLVIEESSRTSITIGNSNSRTQNSIVIKFPIDFCFDEDYTFEKIRKLFKDLIQVFEPYWGCISSYENSQKYGGYYNCEKRKPNAVFWMNYWGNEIEDVLKISDKIGEGKLNELYKVEKLNDGYYFCLQKDPINSSDNSEIEFQTKIKSIFNL